MLPESFKRVTPRIYLDVEGIASCIRPSHDLHVVERAHGVSMKVWSRHLNAIPAPTNLRLVAVFLEVTVGRRRTHLTLR